MKYKISVSQILLIFSFLLVTHVDAQVVLIIEGVDAVLTTRAGYNIPRSERTDLTFRNNNLLSVSSSGFVCQAGDDNLMGTAHNLDGAKIHGNKLLWDSDGTIHGLMVGYNVNYDIKYNYIDSCQYGIVHEGGYNDGESMVNTSGGICYNIFKDCRYSIVEKGFDGTRIYNNTFFNSKEGLYILSVKSSDTGGLTTIPVSKNIKVKNNIFYTVNANIHAIRLGSPGDDTPSEMDTEGFESDYNVFYCENRPNHEPIFQYNGQTLSWTEWRALGYDQHSVVVNPDFIDTESFIPCGRLNYGTVLGSAYEYGLSTSATWNAGSYTETVRQHGSWQVGAVLYGDVSTGWGLHTYGEDGK